MAAAPAQGDAARPRPLDGVLVIALEHAVAAPVCTRHLADQGARIIKIERPGEGDFARRYDQRVKGMSSYFVWGNRSKESLTLDLKDPRGAEALRRLLERADVLVQNLAPGAVERMGWSRERLAELNPRLVSCDISGYGVNGPYRDHKAYDLMIQAESGLLSVTGTAQAMARTGFSSADIGAGLYAYSSIMAALLLRERTGRGSHIDLSMYESLTELLGNPIYYTYEGAPPAPRTGAFHPSVVPYGPVSAGDGGQVLMGVQNEREWVVFCDKALGRPELATDPRFASNLARTENRAALEAIINECFAALDTETLETRLAQANIATGRINTPGAFWTHPQNLARDRMRTIDSPAGPVTSWLPPGVSDAYEARMGAVPALGQHTDSILAELGFAPGEIAAMRADAVI
jgi:itaconate CoA-transferase